MARQVNSTLSKQVADDRTEAIVHRVEQTIERWKQGAKEEFSIGTLRKLP